MPQPRDLEMVMFHPAQQFFAYITIGFLLLSTAAIAESERSTRIGPGDPVAGYDKAALCFGCHAEDGNSTVPTFPKLSGQYGLYISKQMVSFLAGTRSHQTMSDLAFTVNDEDIDDISAYFANLPIMKGNAGMENELGRELYENGDLSRMVVRCGNCHGATGKGLNDDNPVNPVIGGQHKDYLLNQLRSFKNGSRSNSAGGIMNTTVSRLTDSELEALADYISSM